MFLLVRFLSALIRILPEFALRGICVVLGTVLYLIPSKRRILHSNFAHVYPHLQQTGFKKLAWINSCRTIEMGLFALASPAFSNETIRKRLEFADGFEENYHRVAGDSPMLILLPHNYLNEMVIFVPLMLGLPEKKAAAIFRPMDHPKLDDWIRSTRERGGLKLLSRRGGLEAAIAHLRASGHLAILVDQNAGDSGILGRVAGRSASLSPFPDLLVRKFPVQIAFVYIERTGFFRGRLHLESPENRDQEPSLLFADWLSKKLIDSSDWNANWLWMHRRWKSQRKPEKRLRLELKRGISKDFFPIPDDRSQADRFYIRLPNWLGDIVMVTPVIRALRKGRPDVRITLVFRPSFAPLIDLLKIPYDDLLPADSRNSSGLKPFKDRRLEYPDTAILFTNSFRGDREMRATGAEQRFGILRQVGRRPLLTHTWKLPADLDEKKIHQTELWTQFLQHFGLQEDPDFTPVENLNTVTEHEIALFCGSENSPEKRWQENRWIELIRMLLYADPVAKITLYGTTKDQPTTASIAKEVDSERLHDLAGKTDLEQLGKELQRSQLAIGNDTGGMHLANALGCPAVILFGPTNPLRTKPIFEAPLKIVQANDATKTGGGTMEAITVEETFKIIEGLL